MSTENTRTSIGVLVSSDLKDRISAIAQKEHRSLSGQAEFFLAKSVEHWEHSSNRRRPALARNDMGGLCVAPDPIEPVDREFTEPGQLV